MIKTNTVAYNQNSKIERQKHYTNDRPNYLISRNGCDPALSRHQMLHILENKESLRSPKGFDYGRA